MEVYEDQPSPPLFGRASGRRGFITRFRRNLRAIGSGRSLFHSWNPWGTRNPTVQRTFSAHSRCLLCKSSRGRENPTLSIYPGVSRSSLYLFKYNLKMPDLGVGWPHPKRCSAHLHTWLPTIHGSSVFLCTDCKPQAFRRKSGYFAILSCRQVRALCVYLASIVPTLCYPNCVFLHCLCPCPLGVLVGSLRLTSEAKRSSYCPSL